MKRKPKLSIMFNLLHYFGSFLKFLFITPFIFAAMVAVHIINLIDDENELDIVEIKLKTKEA